MNMLKTFAVSAVLLASVSTTFAASPFDVMGGLGSLQSISDAQYATVLKVNDAEANSLRFDNDIASIQQRIKNNRFLVNTIAAQGYTVDQIVGIDASDDGASITLFAI